MASPAIEPFLFPSLSPYQSDFLETGSVHRLYYAQYGNPEGIPLLWLHGGPGAGCQADDARFCDPQLYRIILLDQRGSGQSTPLGEIQGNSTPELINDLESLRRHLGLESWVLMGSSWGSALALAYGQAYPAAVRAFLLRSVFTATVAEKDYYWTGIPAIFPDEYQRLLDFIPPSEQGDLSAAYIQRILHPDPPISLGAMRRLCRYTAVASYVHIPQIILDSIEQEASAKMISMMRLFAHYHQHHAFLEEDQLLKNLPKITHLPCRILHGRYDILCPLKNAYHLHQQWPGSILYIAEQGGHTKNEEDLAKGLKRLLAEYAASL